MTIEMSAEVLPSSCDQRLAIEEFYARQMALLDEGHADDWANTFTESATFSTPRTSIAGRADLARTAKLGVADRSRRGVVHRHIQTALLVSGTADAPVCSSYVLVVESGTSAAPTIHVSCVCVDEMQFRAGEYLVTRRTVRVDGLA
jgi:hypothetical protein